MLIQTASAIFLPAGLAAAFFTPFALGYALPAGQESLTPAQRGRRRAEAEACNHAMREARSRRP